MTPIQLLEALRDFIQNKVHEFDFITTSGEHLEVAVNIGTHPGGPTPTAPTITLELVKTIDQEDSKASISIIFENYTANVQDEWRNQLNIVEHVRQALLKQRTIADKFRLELPLTYKNSAYSKKPYPKGYGFLTATYFIGQIQEEGLFHD